MPTVRTISDLFEPSINDFGEAKVTTPWTESLLASLPLYTQLEGN
jgi:hypothetical protein